MCRPSPSLVKQRGSKVTLVALIPLLPSHGHDLSVPGPVWMFQRRQSFAFGVLVSTDGAGPCLERGFYSHLRLSFTVHAGEPFEMLHRVRAM